VVDDSGAETVEAGELAITPVVERSTAAMKTRTERYFMFAKEEWSS